MGPAVDDEIFSAEAYKLNIPTLDDRKATKLDIRFSGSGALDRTSEDDLALLEAMRIGAPVRLIVTGEVSGKAFKLGTGDNAEFSYSCTVRVAKRRGRRARLAAAKSALLSSAALRDLRAAVRTPH
jgi:hypothetical protein